MLHNAATNWNKFREILENAIQIKRALKREKEIDKAVDRFAC